MASSLSHRGPDATGVWASGPVGFAHTRLSLFDLSAAANQPWTDGSDALTFNGEIYNFLDLRRELEAAGESFHTSSDTEVAFAALRRWGVRPALQRFRGMFAFAFYEQSSGSTYLCRDRFGIKPLLYTQHGGGIAFASEVKALMAIGTVNVDPVQALLAMRTLGDKSQTRTLFTGVSQVPNGSLVVVRDGQVIDVANYSPLLAMVDEAQHRELDLLGFDGAADQLRELLEGAVDAMAACDARLGTFLSGGVDSGLITAIAAGQDHQDLRAFTSDVVGPSSEVEAATATSKALGVPLSISKFHPEDWIRQWVRCTWHLETPVITNPSAVPFAAVAGVAHAEGYKAVLTGEGADELFLGYPRLGSRSAERLAGLPMEALGRLYRRVPGLADAILNERNSASNTFMRGVGGGFEDDELRLKALERYDFLAPAEAELQAKTAVLVQSSLQALLQRNDRMGMAASIESRFPFLDEEVVRFALNTPIRFKLRRSAMVHDPKHPFVIDKALVRATADRYVDRPAARRRKAGFPTLGLRGLQVRSGAFAGSWVSQQFGAGQSFDGPIDTWPQSYDPAKLMAIEIFGRLFGAGEPVERVQDFVHRNVTLAP
jgi:asparagine synthase (glutamine-hydrolysing)